jgi:predicted MPP superfamily phosphohydrolase
MKHSVKRSFIFFLTLILLWLAIGFGISRWSLKVTKYQITAEALSAPIRIVEISDLHCRSFGDKLPDLIREQHPDLIFFVGDLVDMGDSDSSAALATLRSLSPIAPVYVSMGNHDIVFEAESDPTLQAEFTETGAKVLHFSYEDMVVKGQKLRIGGLFGYCLPGKYVEAREHESQFLREFQDTENYTLLLSHMPVCWIINHSLEYWDVDCVFSGHSHGGQVRLPFVGGLYAPDQGWFPGECSGHFSYENRHLFVTTGLGGNFPIPRFYNRPEVAVIDLLPQTTS